ncbi:acyl-ACP thioesterase [Nocardia pseudobrasiliensis]|uniref:Acyl-ACP thioesterase n=2 Tax=Nocardia pseudobrasiliensis TaxID=45979 RepID=A0A370HMG0_9NOCA|nr:acyl-ACP thioesterase [Nocardia pseudobrasiliensis]
MSQLVSPPRPVLNPMTEPLAPVPESGHIFDIQRRLGTADMDEHQYLRIDGIARHLQEAGVDHLVHTDAMDTHPHWIVRRTVIDVIRPVEWPAQLRVRRWCSGLSSRWVAMRVRIDSSSGGLIETEGFWIHMNKEAMSPSRMSDSFFDLMATTALDQRLRWKQWLTTPLPPVPGIPFPLRRTDIDHFEHVTNTAYWHAVHEYASPTTHLTQSPHRYILEYNKPIHFGDRVHLHPVHAPDSLTLYFTVENDIRAVAHLTPLPA